MLPSRCELQNHFMLELRSMGVMMLGCTPVSIFDVDKEDEALLQSWLRYRGIEPSGDVREQVRRDFLRPNGRHLALFTDFDPMHVSQDFLQVWLSWYGITPSAPSSSKQWYIDRAIKVQRFIESLRDQSIMSFRDLARDMQRLRRLRKEADRTVLVLDVKFRDITSASRTVLRHLPPKLTWSERLQWLVKQLFARAMDAGALLLPYGLWQTSTLPHRVLKLALLSPHLPNVFSADVQTGLREDILRERVLPAGITRQLAASVLSNSPKLLFFLDIALPLADLMVRDRLKTT